nr:fungal specific transcription factor domain-containing protein [Colletotrichum truncatum]KAF6784437.1 fungal specific transcription factor domain-containing protein [Colletotrichum truncatum]
MDGITPEGEKQHQYLGFSSMFPYSEPLLDSENSGSRNHGEINEPSRLPCASPEAHPEPEPIVAHLLDLFWEWQSSHLLVVDRSLFLQHRKNWDDNEGKGDRNFFSPCLLYAILALASMISLDKGVRRYSSSSGGDCGDQFAKRALSLFELELGRPTITTVQAALILGSRYGAMKNSSLGWTYSGIAFRIASDLGLHLDCSKAVASGRMGLDIANLRRRVFWACHNEDSAVRGRSPTFMEWDIAIAPPDQPLDETNLTESILQATSTLSVIRSKIMVELYGKRRHSTVDLHFKASQLHESLRQWHRNLPLGQRWPRNQSDTTPPQVLTLQYVLPIAFISTLSWTLLMILVTANFQRSMAFYFNLIILHRPFLHLSQISSDLRNKKAPYNSATATCAAASENIIKLASEYESSYNLRQIPQSVVPFIFIAGTIQLLLYRVTKVESYNRLLQSCTGYLSEVGNSYPVAQRALGVLEDMITNWKPFDETKHSDDITHACDESPEVTNVLNGEIYHKMEKCQERFINSSPSELLDEFGLYGEATMGHTGNDCTFLGSGMDWLSNNEVFDSIDGNICPLPYT